MQESNQLWQVYYLANQIMGFPCQFQQVKTIHSFYKLAYLQFMEELQRNGVITIKNQKIIHGHNFQWKQSYFDNLNSTDHRG